MGFALTAGSARELHILQSGGCRFIRTLCPVQFEHGYGKTLARPEYFPEPGLGIQSLQV
jgi:hypothetical protein